MVDYMKISFTFLLCLSLFFLYPHISFAEKKKIKAMEENQEPVVLIDTEKD